MFDTFAACCTTQNLKVYIWKSEKLKLLRVINIEKAKSQICFSQKVEIQITVIVKENHTMLN